ncbi:hypothetical protein [Coralloluteibacterium stylophorae]|uniref:Uncharacterized protein n=1 Tax=Coralloluteibacterium stylophorae TaxID=1776034 RepID=A0AAP2C8Q9_9GAMM|nr:hypothetical protein [Coralloluteibacterium stylophorae]MBS7456057.1 hypothetical protein [Coralloluteibacterium stylophorae]
MSKTSTRAFEYGSIRYASSVDRRAAFPRKNASHASIDRRPRQFGVGVFVSASRGGVRDHGRGRWSTIDASIRIAAFDAAGGDRDVVAVSSRLLRAGCFALPVLGNPKAN